MQGLFRVQNVKNKTNKLTSEEFAVATTLPTPQKDTHFTFCSVLDTDK